MSQKNTERNQLTGDHLSPEVVSMLYDNLQESVIILNQEGEIQFANQRFFNLFNLKPDNLKGIQLRDLLQGPGSVHLLEAVNELHAGDSLREIKVFLDILGRPQKLSAKVLPLPPDASKVVLLLNEDLRQIDRDVELQILAVSIHSSIAATALADLDGKLTHLNHAASELWGYDDPDELIGRTIESFYASAERVQVVRDALAAHGSWQGEMKGVRKDGSLVDLQVSTSQVVDIQGEPLCLMASMIDITERNEVLRELEAAKKQLELTVDERTERLIDTEAQMRSLLNAITEIALLVDHDMRAIAVNQAACAYLGRNEEEVVGQNISQWMDPETAENRFNFIQQVIETGNPVRFMDHDPTRGLIFNTSYYPVKDDSGNVVFIAVFAFDMTEFHQADQQLHEYNIRLEEIVSERTKDLQDTQEKLFRQEKLLVLGQMAGGVAHELRNPLGVMSNAVQYLKMILSDPSEKVLEYFDLLSDQIRKSNQIITDLTNFSRVQRTAPERQDVQVAEIFESCTQHWNKPEDIELVIDFPKDLPDIYVDPRQIGQVIDNLIRNACDAMSDQGVLTVSARHQEASVRISIRDTGVGIAEENLDKVFEPLFTTKRHGVGLGLVISRHMVEANQGTIAIETKPGVGTTFYVDLPVAVTIPQD